jgi:ribonuclease P protein component
MVFAGSAPKPLSPKGGSLDVMAFRHIRGTTPLLLVAASRRTGGAVARNRFRRRVRMALLAVLRKRDGRDGGFAIWVRPAKGSPLGCRLDYPDIERQLEASLDRLEHR